MTCVLFLSACFAAVAAEEKGAVLVRKSIYDRAVRVYNRTPRGRAPLNAVVSSDGKTWKDAVVLEDEPGEYSYPAVIEATDGKVHVTYTSRRRKIRHLVPDPSKP